MKKELEKQIKERINKLESIIKMLGEQEIKPVRGTLKIAHSGKYIKYYHVEEKGGRTGKYIRNTDLSYFLHTLLRHTSLCLLG